MEGVEPPVVRVEADQQRAVDRELGLAQKLLAHHEGERLALSDLLFVAHALALRVCDRIERHPTRR